MIVSIAINRSLCMFVCLFGWWGVLVIRRELLLSEFLFNQLDRTACTNYLLAIKSDTLDSMNWRMVDCTRISERFRQFCFFTKRSTLLLEKSRKINFLHLFFIEQHAKLFRFLLMLVDQVKS